MIPRLPVQLVARRRVIEWASVLVGFAIGAGLSLVLYALVGCVEPNPYYCEADEDCAAGQVCDLEGAGGVRNRCVPAPDAGGGAR